jgi:hypothetical protein
MRDIAKTYLHGVKEIWIRTDLVARDIKRSIVADIEYIDVRRAFLSLRMKAKFRELHKH